MTGDRLPKSIRRRLAVVPDTPPPAEPRCRCSHRKAQHGKDRIGRDVCYGSSVCGCVVFRPDDVDASMGRHPAGKAQRNTYPRNDGGPAIREFLASRGEI